MGESEAKLVVVGRLWVEHVAEGPRLPKPGETVESVNCEDGVGGRGARQAVAVGRLGVPVALVSPIGHDDRAESLLRWLAAENVDTRRLRRDQRISSGASLVQLDSRGDRQTMVFPEAHQAISAADVEAGAEAITSTRAVLVSLQVPQEAAARAIALAHIARARIVLDAAGAEDVFHDDDLGALDVLHATAREAEVLTSIEVRGPATATAAAEWLIARGLAAALIDAGPDGHLLATAHGTRMFPRLAPPGADEEIGDEAFVAALAAARAEGRSLEDAATFASAAEARVSPERGVRAFPRRDAVLRYLDVLTGRSWEIDEAA
jgi:ribokinase